MIKSNELRIGNRIIYAGKEIIVEGIVRNTIHHSNGQFDQNIEPSYEPFNPIQLSEERLLKFGFEKSSTDGSNEWDNYDSNPENAICGEFVDNEFYFTGGEGIPFSRKCKFVHEFQNLFFALKGVELVFSSNNA